MTDLTNLDLVELGDAIDRGETSPVEIVDAFLNRIEANNGHYNAFVTVTGDEARAAATVSEREIAKSGLRGPLHGLPVGHKDLFATAGVRTTAGSRVLIDNVPDRDATMVARLSSAGMISLGKLNTHEFAYGPTGESSHFGPVRNPWDTCLRWPLACCRLPPAAILVVLFACRPLAVVSQASSQPMGVSAVPVYCRFAGPWTMRGRCHAPPWTRR
jgi:Asp-tRNA(Asn)/Glu-tRNA(Gln) amidotransferase A subunit family amidase